MEKVILIVEDEPFVRSVCSRSVENYGFRPILAENGHEGLQIYTEQHPDIALVLTDVSMPVMDGIEMVHQMFAIQPHSNVILMTGHNAEKVIPENLRKICAILQKPFTSKRLLEAINNSLKYEDQQS
jgi:two-component system, cell cycle sensor histidine kinase and response regulator CckA